MKRFRRKEIVPDVTVKSSYSNPWVLFSSGVKYYLEIKTGDETMRVMLEDLKKIIKLADRVVVCDECDGGFLKNNGIKEFENG
ncbi:unnamed protein product, partial [marine sediment metagenome]